MQLEIEIKTQDKALMRDIVGAEEPGRVREEIDIPGNARLISPSERGRVIETVGAEMALTAVGFLLIFGSNVVASLVASWLWEKIRGRGTGCRIERTLVEFNEGEIKRVLTERIEIALKAENEKAKK